MILSWLLIILSSSLSLAQDMPFASDLNNPFSFFIEHNHIGSAGANDGHRSELDSESMNIGIPLYSDLTNKYYSTIKAEHLRTSDKLTIPERNFDIPQDLGKADVGFGWVGANAEDEHTSASFSVGRSGNQLGDSHNITELGATVSTEVRRFNGDSWIFLINYSNNRTMYNNIPIPGVAYMLSGDNYKLLLGAPFLALNWRPMPVMFNTFLSPFAAYAELSMFALFFQIYTGASWQSKSYQNLTGDNSERLLYERTEWFSGLRMPLGKGSNFSAGYIYDFNRRFMLGKSLSNGTAWPTRLEDAGGFQARLRLTF